MKKYIDLIEDVHDNISGRERLEWSNFWYDRTNKDAFKRILLIGDSTVRMIRSAFAEKTGYAVDMLGTSSGMHDVFFQSQMDAFFCSAQYKYTTIFVQIGHHSRIGDQGETYTEADYRRFYRDMNALVTFLKQYCDNIVMLSIFFSVISPKSYWGIIGSIAFRLRHYFPEKYDDTVNIIKKRKNEIIFQIAKERGLPFCDINQIVMDTAKGCRNRFIHEDHVHLEKSANSFIVDEYVKYIV